MLGILKPSSVKKLSTLLSQHMIFGCLMGNFMFSKCKLFHFFGLECKAELSSPILHMRFLLGNIFKRLLIKFINVQGLSQSSSNSLNLLSKALV